MKFKITHPDGSEHELISEATTEDGAAMMHWGKNTAKEVFDVAKVMIEKTEVFFGEAPVVTVHDDPDTTYEVLSPADAPAVEPAAEPTAETPAT